MFEFLYEDLEEVNLGQTEATACAKALGWAGSMLHLSK